MILPGGPGPERNLIEDWSGNFRISDVVPAISGGSLSVVGEVKQERRPFRRFEKADQLFQDGIGENDAVVIVVD